jgi:hypothetical protein
MAKLGQVCNSGQNCALIEDSGINTAYTIAHEIGHLYVLFIFFILIAIFTIHFICLKFPIKMKESE